MTPLQRLAAGLLALDGYAVTGEAERLRYRGVAFECLQVPEDTAATLRRLGWGCSGDCNDERNELWIYAF